MRSVETTGGTIDEAIARALAALGATRDQVEIEILQSASRGVLGIRRTKARVRATMRAPLRAWLDEEPRSEPASPVRVPAASASPAGAQGGVDGASVLREILALMGIDGTVVEGQGQEGERVLDVTGPGRADVIGRRGEVLDALEYVVNRILERAGDAARFVLDAAGYRAERRASLAELAHRLAERARRRGKPVTLEALSPADRRTLYLALRAEGGVTARSLGQGMKRKLVIIPEGRRRGVGKAAK